MDSSIRPSAENGVERGGPRTKIDSPHLEHRCLESLGTCFPRDRVTCLFNWLLSCTNDSRQPGGGKAERRETCLRDPSPRSLSLHRASDLHLTDRQRSDWASQVTPNSDVRAVDVGRTQAGRRRCTFCPRGQATSYSHYMQPLVRISEKSNIDGRRLKLGPNTERFDRVALRNAAEHLTNTRISCAVAKDFAGCWRDGAYGEGL